MEGGDNLPPPTIEQLLGQVRDEIAGLRADLAARLPAAEPDLWDGVPEVDGL